jgi:hypothetical protein
METARPFAAIDAIIISALVCGAFLTFNKLGSLTPDTVAVFRQNAVIAEYPLKNDVSFTVNGKRGSVGIEIKNGAAKISHATCPRGICKLSGAISNSNGRIICAPNNIMVQIRSSGARENGVDGVTY